MRAMPSLPARLTRTTLLLFSTGVLGLVVARSSPARAQIEGVRPEVHLNLGYHADLGVGLRIDIPIVPEGLLASARDELALSPGFDLLFDDGDVWVGIPIALQWNFYVASKWSIFPELGVALLVGEHHRDRDDDLHVDPLLAVGGRWHWNARNALVLRVGWPIGVQFGVTF
jgi:hypothetical protein